MRLKTGFRRSLSSTKPAVGLLSSNGVAASIVTRVMTITMGTNQLSVDTASTIVAPRGLRIAANILMLYAPACMQKWYLPLERTVCGTA